MADSFSIAAPDSVLVDSAVTAAPSPGNPALILLLMTMVVLGAFVWMLTSANEFPEGQ